MRNRLLTLLLLSGVLSFSFGQDAEIDKKVEELLAKMTLAEKVGQMNQYTGFFDVTGPPPKDGNAKNKYDHVRSGMVGSMLNIRGVEEVRAMQKIAVEQSRLGIPIIFAFDVIHGFKTVYPIPLAEAASWDLDAIELSARNAAIEATAAGLNWTFAPMVDISRDARWGRVMEGAGEDPYLGSRIAEARIAGFQGTDLSAPNTIATCAKHFAAYGFAEAGRDYNTADIGVSTLYNVVLPPFKAAAEAGVSTFMNSFNELNGVPATGDVFLQREILKGEWDFQGFVVSDWGSIGELVPHGHASDGKHAAEVAVNAGSDMDMESHLYIQHLEKLVKSGVVDEAKIDDAVRRILRLKFELGLFDDPYRYCDEEREKQQISNDKQMADALDIAKKSIVLLKNDGNLLPLPKEGKKIALIGPFADDDNGPLGSWRLASDDHTAVSVLEGLESYKGIEVPSNEISFAQGVRLLDGEATFQNELQINMDDRTGMEEAVELAKTSDIVVLVLGEHGFQSGEGRSRVDLGLPGLQQELLEKVHAVNQNIVLVLMSGRPLALPWADENVPAILEAWQLGTQSGNAISQVLYGDYNPSGKLPMTFPRDIGQVPIYYNHKNTGRPGPANGTMVFWSHYTDEDNGPLYPFGHGLSYTSFAYSKMKVEAPEGSREVKVEVQLTNTGEMAGEEVVQLYVRDKVASVTRPVKELKGFEKVTLAKGESKPISFTLTEKELGFYNNHGKFVFEAGEFDIMVGGSSQETMSKTIMLK